MGVVVGCQNFMTLANWERALAISACTSFLVGCIGFRALRSRSPARDSMADVQLVKGEGETRRDFGSRWMRIALFCFCANALPSSSFSVDMLQLSVFRLESYQTLGLISSLA